MVILSLSIWGADCSLASAVTETLLTQCQPPWAFLPLLPQTHPHPHPPTKAPTILSLGIVSWRTSGWWCPLLIPMFNLGLIRRVLVVDVPSLDQGMFACDVELRVCLPVCLPSSSFYSDSLVLSVTAFLHQLVGFSDCYSHSLESI